MTIVKICGITNLKDARSAAALGADVLGFNFYSASPRYIAPEVARDMIGVLGGRVTTVGVFVNERADTVLRMADDAKVDAIQLHGDETAEYVQDLRKKSSIQVIKAFRIAKAFAAGIISEYDVDAILLDADSPNLYGGSGEVADWELARRISALHPRVYLAGGLNPAIVGAAIEMVRPFAVDVASGVESVKGRKDANKMEDFIRNAKNA